MNRGIILLALAAMSLGPSCARRVAPSAPPGSARVQTPSDASAWSLAPLAGQGFHAVSEAVATVDRGDSPVEIADSSMLTLSGGGDFSFRRTRVHSGAADGKSVESTAALRIGDEYFTAGSSGLWVRWDDAVDQPEAQIGSFIASEDGLAAVVRQCARLGEPDGQGRSAVMLSGESCRFATARGPDPTKPYSGNLTGLDGFVVLDGRVPMQVSVSLAFDTTIDGVQADVGIKWTLTVVTGGNIPAIEPPAVFSDARRPRPVRMVESVLGDMVDGWGPGAPESLGRPAVK